MKYLIKLIQLLIITVVIVGGVFVGTSVNSFAQTTPGEGQNDCGTCDYHKGEDLEFCNFTWNTGQCAGNDGGPCGGVPCL